MFIVIFGQTPILLMHGIQMSGGSMDGMAQWIRDEIPDAYVYSCPVAEGDQSIFMNMDDQISELAICIQNNKLLQDGFIAVGFSQGGYMLRAYIHKYNQPKAIKFITLSSPLAGYYCGIGNPCGSIYFPEWLNNLAGELIYTEFIQDLVGPCGYWRDPHHIDLFKEYSVSLADIEGMNQVNETYKKNFEQLQQVVMFGSPVDEVIWPWQSTWFGFYEDGTSNMLDMTMRKEFINSGMKTLYDQGKVLRIDSNHGHQDYFNEPWFKTNVIQYLKD